MKQNTLKSNEWQKIWVLKSFKSEIQKEGQNNSDVPQNWFFQENRSLSLICRNFKSLRKILLKRGRMHWNVMIDKVFSSLKLLKLKSRRGYRIIQTFFRIGSLQKLDPPFLICRNLKYTWIVENVLKSNEWQNF